LDRFISERELFEAKNLALVVAYINQEAKQKELTLNMILFLHKMLISNIQDEIAGRFRQENEWVRVANHIACDPKHIVEKLEDMFITYDSSPTKNIIKRIAAFHLEFEYIHPFVDGNGRIGRVLNNYLLIREGYVPINIKFIDRSDYYDAFREYDENRKSAIMEEIIGKAITNSYHKRLAYLEELEIVTLNTFAKRNNISHSNLINKAKRQTIEAFSEKGIWKIGIPRP
jgi:Fic family protein